ncbi:MAG: WbqC family protein [Cyclobacteriaceae bacterium]
MKVIIDLHYLPCLEYFTAILSAEKIFIEKHEQYLKQSYRNRCYINTANGLLKLVVPVTAKHSKALVCDVKVDKNGNWQNNHWRAISSAYGKAPFFDHYAEELHQILFKEHLFLYDLNMDLLSFCLQNLQVSLSLTESTSYQKIPQKDITDLRSVISAKNPHSDRDHYLQVPYLQVFGNKFASNLSFIDLLFCEGPNAIQIIRSSTKGDLNK